jgi:hypothetical protein
MIPVMNVFTILSQILEIFQDITSESGLKGVVERWSDVNEAPVKVTSIRRNFKE